MGVNIKEVKLPKDSHHTILLEPCQKPIRSILNEHEHEHEYLRQKPIRPRLRIIPGFVTNPGVATLCFDR